MASPSLASSRGADEPKLLMPGLAGFYAWAEPYTYPLMRFCAGAMLIPIGWTKLHTGMGPVIATMTKYGLEPAGLTALVVVALESLGALCVALEMAVISYVQIPNGFTRVEQFLLWGVLFLIIALRGGGRFSVDRAIGREL
jgi:putative oxidoreductase